MRRSDAPTTTQTSLHDLIATARIRHATAPSEHHRASPRKEAPTRRPTSPYDQSQRSSASPGTARRLRANQLITTRAAAQAASSVPPAALKNAGGSWAGRAATCTRKGLPVPRTKGFPRAATVPNAQTLTASHRSRLMHERAAAPVERNDKGPCCGTRGTRNHPENSRRALAPD